jgi:hypothetical protein
MKHTALQNIISLEKMGKITRKNGYQDLLNNIATDIRTKHRRRITRQNDLESTRHTLAQLEEKAEFLKEQLAQYEIVIDQNKKTMQTNKGYNPLHNDPDIKVEKIGPSVYKAVLSCAGSATKWTNASIWIVQVLGDASRGKGHSRWCSERSTVREITPHNLIRRCRRVPPRNDVKSIQRRCTNRKRRNKIRGLATITVIPLSEFFV